MAKYESRLGWAAIQRYNSSDNFYHNWAHASQVARAVRTISNRSAKEDGSVVLAAYWHDAIYVPGAKDNEILSAQALRNEAVNYPSVDKDLVEEAATLIEQTTIGNHLRSDRVSDKGLATLLDADLFGLTVDYDSFIINQNKIILENGGDVRLDKPKCAKFLRQFLFCREFIYHTPFMRVTFEAKARRNIIEYVIEFGEQE